MAYVTQEVNQEIVEYREVEPANNLEKTINELIYKLAKLLNIPEGRRSIDVTTGRNVKWCLKAAPRWIQLQPNNKDVDLLVDSLYLLRI